MRTAIATRTCYGDVDLVKTHETSSQVMGKQYLLDMLANSSFGLAGLQLAERDVQGRKGPGMLVQSLHLKGRGKW